MIKKRAIAFVGSLSAFMAVTVFVGWGFDPQSWTVGNRLFWALVGCAFVGLTTTFPFSDD